MKPKPYVWQQTNSDIPEANMHGLIKSDVRHGDFKSTGRTAHTAPKVVEIYTDDEGEEWYGLDNGNQSRADTYNSLWHPVRGSVQPKQYMGANPDKTKVV